MKECDWDELSEQMERAMKDIRWLNRGKKSPGTGVYRLLGGGLCQEMTVEEIRALCASRRDSDGLL